VLCPCCVIALCSLCQSETERRGLLVAMFHLHLSTPFLFGYRGTEVWHIQHKTLTIDTLELTKYKRWLLVMVCLFTLILIKEFTTTYHNINLFDKI
jgi:hypothetical protein